MSMVISRHRISAHSKINKLTQTSRILVKTAGCHSGDPCSFP